MQTLRCLQFQLFLSQTGLLMFETSLVESSGALKSKSGRFMGVTAAFNIAVVAVMILIPLLYPEALPRTAITAMLSAPPPPPAAPARTPPEAVRRAVKATAAVDPFTVPTSVPPHIDMVPEDPPQTATGIAVAGMVGTSTSTAGVMDAIGVGAPPLVVKVEPPKSVKPLNISSGVVAGNKLSGATPIYSPIAKAAHVSGAVVLHAIISRAGTIQSLSVVSGHEMLRANAVAAVQQWKYKPYLLNGEPTEVETTITVNFSFGG
jgi:protein TonB